MPGGSVESWTVLGDDGVPIEPVEGFLSYLTAIERSPNTVKAYAHDLKDWFQFLAAGELRWQAATPEDVGRFAAWLRLSPAARKDGVATLTSVRAHCTTTSVNRKLAALTAFCEFHIRRGETLSGLADSRRLPDERRRVSARTAYRPLLHHLPRRGPQSRRAVRLAEPARHPQVLSAPQAQSILDACSRRRDRFLFAVLLDTGLRVGEALGLRHVDVDVAQRAMTVVRRHNANRARTKSATTRTVPTSAELMRLYADYLNGEYGALDSDYVFVNLWSPPVGHPMTYSAVYDLVNRLRTRTGVWFSPHQFRHTYATWLLRRGAGMDSVKELLGHASVSTTIDIYGHLTVEDARATLEQAGWFTGREVRL